MDVKIINKTKKKRERVIILNSKLCVNIHGDRFETEI